MALETINEPITGRRVFSLSNPISGVMGMLAVLASFTFAVYLFFLARNEGAPMLNSLVGRLTGDRVDAGVGQGGFGEVF